MKNRLDRIEQSGEGSGLRPTESTDITTKQLQTTSFDPYYHPEVAYLVEKLKPELVLERKHLQFIQR